MKRLIIKASSSDAPLSKFSCTACGNNTYGTGLQFCPHCGEKLESEPKKLKASVVATAYDSEKAEIKCSHCATDFKVYDSPRSADELSVSLYCPICGESDLEPSEPEEPKEETHEELEKTEPKEESEGSQFNENACVDENCDQVIASDANEQQKEQQEQAESKQDKQDETEEDVAKALDQDNLQWTPVDDAENGEKGTLVAFSTITGMPLYVFKKNKCPKELQSIFASSVMISGFNQIASKEGLGSALVKFGGQIFNNKAIEADNINSLAMLKAKTEILPKLVECMALAAEGAIKGIYPDVRKDLYDSMVNELQGSGIPRERIEACVKATMGSGGTHAYSSLIAKATELLNKDEKVFEEVKATICAATNTYNDEDIEERRVRAALNASVNVTDMISDHLDEVASLRKRLNFGSRR